MAGRRADLAPQERDVYSNGRPEHPSSIGAKCDSPDSISPTGDRLIMFSHSPALQSDRTTSSTQREKLLVISRRVEYLATIIAPRDYVIHTTRDFSARFPCHKAADANPLTAFRQTALTARTLTQNKVASRGNYGSWLCFWQVSIGKFPATKESQNRKPDPVLRFRLLRSRA